MYSYITTTSQTRQRNSQHITHILHNVTIHLLWLWLLLNKLVIHCILTWVAPECSKWHLRKWATNVTNYLPHISKCVYPSNTEPWLLNLWWLTMTSMTIDQHTHTHTHTQPFYGPFSETTRVNQCQKKSSNLLDYYGAREDNRGTYTDHPGGRLSTRTNQQPSSITSPFLRQMPFLSPPSHFILAWDRHQICWFAYPVAWLPSGVVCYV